MLQNDLRYQFYGSVDDRGRRTWDTKAYEQKAKTGYAGRDGLRQEFTCKIISILIFYKRLTPIGLLKLNSNKC